MKFKMVLLPAMTALAMTSVAPGSVAAQQRGTPAQRAQNRQAATDMHSRLAAAIERVRGAEQHGKISPARSAAVRQQLAQATSDMTRLERRQGFVSAAELASYGRLVEQVDAELRIGAAGHSYGNDGLASPEVIAFERMDKRLRYRDARIEYDPRECAVYQGVARDGRVRRAPLKDGAGRPLCTKH